MSTQQLATQQQALTPAQRQLNTVKDLLVAHKNDIAMAVPTFLTPERLIRVSITAFSTTPELLKCSPMSLLGAVIQCAQLGLEPGVQGQAYLIPFGTTVQFVPGYRGLMQLARRSGEIAMIDAHEVYQGDQFEYAYGLQPTLTHVPAPFKDRGQITHFYAAANLKDGASQFTVMTIEEVVAHRDTYSQTAKKGPWVKEFPEMGKKTVLRKLCKYLPSSTELQRAISLDEMAERQLPQRLSGLAGLPDEEETVVNTEETENQAKLAEAQGALAQQRDNVKGMQAKEPSKDAPKTLSATTPFDPKRYEEFYAIIKSSESLDMLNDSWRSLAPFMTRLANHEKGALQKVKDEMERTLTGKLKM